MNYLEVEINLSNYNKYLILLDKDHLQIVMSGSSGEDLTYLN